VPLPQLALHAPQSAQSSHSPSMQHSGWPRQFTTGMTSSLTRGAQSAPSPRGKVSMLRLRRLNPTPQMSGVSPPAGTQSDHSDHTPHLQSTAFSHGGPWQGAACCKSPRQPAVPSVAGSVMLRTRTLEPSPHVREHSPHSLQCPSLQSLEVSLLQEAMPHRPVSIKAPSH